MSARIRSGATVAAAAAAAVAALLLGAPGAPAADSTAGTPAPPSASTAPPAARPHERTAAPLRSVPSDAKPGKAAGMCGVCHGEVRVDFDKGAHKAEGIGCISCHGGDPGATTVAAAHRGNYRGIPRRRDIPTLCASCHADVARMRSYNLPSDQYALYQTSQHAKGLAKGDERVAVCTDCHGVHEIRTTEDPRSKVFARNIPETCGHCHGDPKLIQRYRWSGNPLADYSAGVHGKAFLKDADASAPECTRCHGSHGATPPGVGDVGKVCAQCHAKTRLYFLAGPHAQAMADAGQPECAACHEDHNTRPSTIKTLDAMCAECHEKDSKETRLAGTFRRMFTEAEEEIQLADAMVARAAQVPLYVDDYKARLEDARTALLESFPVMHTMDTLQVEPHTRRARSIAAMVSEEIDEKLKERVWHYVGLGLFWFYLLLTAVILTRARRRAAAERDR